MKTLLRTAPAVFALTLILSGCKKPAHTPGPQSDLPSIEVTTATVETRSRPVLEEVVATVRARVRATIAARINAQIEEMPVVLGQRLAAGDLIARLEAGEITARVEQTEANLQQAERDWNRASELFKAQATTKAEVDAVEARWRVARATLNEARAMLAHTTVTAPFEGVITRKWAESGDLAQPGKPLVELENPAELQLEADVPESVSNNLKSGDTLTVHAGKDPIEAKIREISPAADPITRTLRVKLDLPKSSTLRPGVFARLLIPAAESKSLRVPSAAVVQRGQLELAFVLADQRARLHLIKTGQKVGDEIEVLSGLDSGDTVIVGGAGRLLDGQPVQVR